MDFGWLYPALKSGVTANVAPQASAVFQTIGFQAVIPALKGWGTANVALQASAIFQTDGFQAVIPALKGGEPQMSLFR